MGIFIPNFAGKVKELFQVAPKVQKGRQLKLVPSGDTVFFRHGKLLLAVELLDAEFMFA